MENLLIRNAEPDDAEILCKWWNDGKIMEHAGFPNGLNKTIQDISVQIIDQRGKNDILIIEYDGKCIGEMCYSIKDTVARIGIKICDFDFQERGLGTMCLKMLIDYLINDLNCDKIITEANLKNIRAQHTYEKVGFKKVRINRNVWRNQIGDLQSFVDYELLKSI